MQQKETGLKDLPNLDYLDLANNSKIKGLFENDEQILLSIKVNKFNLREKRQERNFLFTNKQVYNLSEGLRASFLTMFSKESLINRKIRVKSIVGFTYSTLSTEFIIHVPSEYDYRLSSENRDIIIQYIFKALQTNGVNEVSFLFVEDINLHNYATFSDGKEYKKHIFNEKAVKYSYEMFKNFLTDKQKELKAIEERTVALFSKSAQKISLNDFNLLKVLGRGSFGKVVLVEKKDNKELYALKILRKVDIIAKDQVEHLKNERKILEKAQHPFLVGLEYAFQTDDRVYFVLKYMRGGELFQHLRKAKRFDEKTTKFYAAQIFSALDYFHKENIIYRDLKPENILLDPDGNICLTDFGMARSLNEGQKAQSFVGTPEYLAPEIILCKGHNMAADWWSLGILIFEMMVGIPPFYNKNANTMFQWIVTVNPKFPSGVAFSEHAKDLIIKLLEKNPEKRIGSKNSDEIKNHPFFADIDFEKLLRKEVTPPIKPELKDAFDTTNFDEEFTKEDPRATIFEGGNKEINLLQYQKEFKDMHFNKENNQ